MSSCCVQTGDTGRFFGWFARRYRKRFARKGFEASQKQLVEGVRGAGLEAATLLEIGCGVGYLHQRLLQIGAASAVGVDLSSKMLSEARSEALAQGLAERTEYREGDFVEMTDTIDAADIVILDKVICCYPDADALVHSAMRKARRVCAFTLPRDRLSVRLVLWFGRAMLALIRCGFRSYVHDPVQIDRWLREAGLQPTFEARTFVWLTRVYARPGPGASATLTRSTLA